jgi:hypothetical protein
MGQNSSAMACVISGGNSPDAISSGVMCDRPAVNTIVGIVRMGGACRSCSTLDGMSEPSGSLPIDLSRLPLARDTEILIR